MAPLPLVGREPENGKALVDSTAPYNNSRMDAPEANELPPHDAAPGVPADLPKSQVEFFLRAAEKVRTQFPDTQGV